MECEIKSRGRQVQYYLSIAKDAIDTGLLQVGQLMKVGEGVMRFISMIMRRGKKQPQYYVPLPKSFVDKGVLRVGQLMRVEPVDQLTVEDLAQVIGMSSEAILNVTIPSKYRALVSRGKIEAFVDAEGQSPQRGDLWGQVTFDSESQCFSWVGEGETPSNASSREVARRHRGPYF